MLWCVSRPRNNPHPPQATAASPPVRAIFHPASTAAGAQPCVVVGTHAGTVVRYNDPAEAGLLRYGKSTAQAEPALPHADPEAELTRAIRGPAHPDAPRRAAEREYYEVHRAPILCLGFVNVDSLELATLDADGVLAKWPCKGEPLSGRLWHRPSRVAQLDFTIHDRMEASTGAVDRR